MKESNHTKSLVWGKRPHFGHADGADVTSSTPVQLFRYGSACVSFEKLTDFVRVETGLLHCRLLSCVLLGHWGFCLVPS